MLKPRKLEGPIPGDMSTETVLLISTPQNFANRFEVESLGLTLCNQADRQGGVGWAGWLESGVMKVRIHGAPPDEIRRWTTAYFAAVEKRAKSVSVIEQQAEETPLPNIAAGEIPWGTVLRQKLTKKILRLLPEGVYVTSNLFSGGEEVYSERVGPLETSENTWRRATVAGANNRLCRLLWTEDDFNGLSLASYVPEVER